MAKKVQIILEDDLDGSNADETVTFGLDGATYEIDLTAQHAEELRSALNPFVGAARKTGKAKGSRASGSSGVDTKKVRAWAIENGIDVPGRGRIPKNVVEKYVAAN